MKLQQVLILFCFAITFDLTYSDSIAFTKIGSYQGRDGNNQLYTKSYYLPRHFQLHNWFESANICRLFNMKLATFDSLAEFQAAQNFLLQNLNGLIKYIHIGGMANTPRSPTDWYWAETNKKINFALPWNVDNPNFINNNEWCLALDLKAETHDLNCYSPQNFLCDRIDEVCRICDTRDGREGTCRLISDCKQAHVDQRSGIYPTFCSGNIICCTSPNALSSNERISLQKCREYTNLVKKEVNFVGGLSLFSSATSIDTQSCVFSTGLIVGGQEAEEHEYPHSAAIGWESLEGIEFKCGGSLIDKRYILTAAHCFPRSSMPTFVRLGEHNINLVKMRTENDYGIETVIMHPNYSSFTNKNDIALIKLDQDVTFSDSIRPACLWQTKKYNFTKAIASGWGKLGFQDNSSDVLMKVSLNIVENTNCSSRLDNIVDSKICAGGHDGRDTCQGDSGGPLHVTLDSNKCIHHIFGITSYGFACGYDIPGVYTRVSSYLNWIEQIVWKRRN